ncbi:hypothetical protein BTR22_05275 [Alkalihalophilus pseudofirmus]|uniref:hypothetical protein n=1 Tax=Alkalihalophilus pseudofirmus TaxID=79885 RepID=UPI0009526FD4|nr:hypothetical protein BTR22_05275 [Alkalihalophilus pseudofirmus]
MTAKVFFEWFSQKKLAFLPALQQINHTGGIIMKDFNKTIQEMQEQIELMMKMNREMKELVNENKLILENVFLQKKGDAE